MRSQWFAWCLTFSLFFVFLWASFGQSPSARFKKEQELKRIEMVQLSRELGATCTACHNPANWAEDSKPTFKISLQHMKIVDILRHNGMDGKLNPEASCFMCHQGRLRFAHKMSHPESAPNSKK